MIRVGRRGADGSAFRGVALRHGAVSCVAAWTVSCMTSASSGKTAPAPLRVVGKVPVRSHAAIHLLTCFPVRAERPDPKIRQSRAIAGGDFTAPNADLRYPDRFTIFWTGRMMAHCHHSTHWSARSILCGVNLAEFPPTRLPGGNRGLYGDGAVRGDERALGVLGNQGRGLARDHAVVGVQGHGQSGGQDDHREQAPVPGRCVCARSCEPGRVPQSPTGNRGRHPAGVRARAGRRVSGSVPRPEGGACASPAPGAVNR